MLENLKHLFSETPKHKIRETDALNQVDLGFIIDTTGSMGPFIATAKQHLLDVLATFRDRGNLDLQVGLVEYRDHPPQDRTFVTRIHPLTANLPEMQRTINRLHADGGGDYPEAVYDGVRDACEGLKWRPHSYRFALLVGDAPPHGFQSSSDRARAHRSAAATDTDRATARPLPPEPSCLCGLRARDVTAAAEGQRVVVNGLCMQANAVTLEAFTEIAVGTGGQCVVARNAGEVMAAMLDVLEREFGQLAFDRQVLERLQPLKARGLDTERLDAIGADLGQSRLQVAKAIARLGKRGFLTLTAA